MKAIGKYDTTDYIVAGASIALTIGVVAFGTIQYKKLKLREKELSEQKKQLEKEEVSGVAGGKPKSQEDCPPGKKWNGFFCERHYNFAY